MCGIAGAFHLNGQPISPVVLRKMTDAIAHRGPDSEGFYTDSFVGLGHRRLSIIDLSSAGHQPMVSNAGNLIITYNGEIYNFKELRSELEMLGYRFKSQTDTEVILYAFAQWGIACVTRFNGMFAFVIWDKTRQELFIARDRYGIKPLYYTFRDNTFIFGSEQKAILAHPLVQRKIDLEALIEYFTFQNIFTDKTLLKDIKLFPAGCWASLQLGEGVTDLKIHRYWDFCFQESEQQATEEEYIEELGRLFNQAVSRQLMSDVAIGTYLSGGIDSGSITAIAAKHLPYIKSFTCGFDLNSASGLELGFDERENAEYMSYLFRTEHYEMVLKAGDMERVLPKLAYHLEEPRVGQSYPNYYAAQLASKFVKVVLSGAGGDEIFGGYPWRYYRAAVNSNFEDYIDKYYLFWQRLISNKEIEAVFSPIREQVAHVWTRDIFCHVFQQHANVVSTPEEYINHSLYFEAKTFLHGLLVVEDKLSMAHGLETRVPFLDNDLVDFAMKIPIRLKLRNIADVIKLNENDVAVKNRKAFDKTNDGKYILRRVMENHIPSQINRAIKQGFSAPDASWFRGESIEYLKSIIDNERSCIYNFMDKKVVQSIVEQHICGKENKRLFVWALLNFEQWCAIYL